MKSNKFLVLLLLGIVIFSCRKNDDSSITYPSVYQKSGLKAAGSLRLFSLNGEIRDPEILSRFNLLDSANFTIYSEYIRDNQETMRSIQLSDPQHAIMNVSYDPKNCLVTRDRSLMILTATDTSIGYSEADEFTRSPSYYIGQIKPEVYSEYLISSTRGFYQFGYTGRENFILADPPDNWWRLLYSLHCTGNSKNTGGMSIISCKKIFTKIFQWVTPLR